MGIILIHGKDTSHFEDLSHNIKYIETKERTFKIYSMLI